MKFVSITKPGIIFGNVITALGGFFLASQIHLNFGLLLATLIGISLVIASGCVFNNVIDRDIDKLMERTKNRVLVRGLISGKVAIVYAIILGILGLAVLYCLANPLTAIIAVIGLFFYVIAYSLYFKRNSIYGTVIGAISGAIPPVVGYTAVTNRFDVGAVILFMILFFWQMPHFYAISICRLNDYSAASIPILPIKKDLRHTKISMLVYMVAFTIASILPSVVGLTGKIYFIAALAMGLIWLGIGLKGFKADNEISWARKVFMFSIINITLLSILMIVRV